MSSKTLSLLVFVVLVGSALLVACEGETREVEVTRIVTEKETVVETIVENETVVENTILIEKETVVETVIVQTTQPPAPEGPRTLVVCLGQEPASLYLYGGSMQAANHVRQAVYDGPIDSRTFGFQPVILEKLPSLADGDAVLEAVTVETGDLMVDDTGNPVTLEEGVLVRPTGCHDAECAVEYDGTPLEMEQMIVTYKLIEGILWSDGEPLTAYDSIYSFDVNADPDTPASRYTIDLEAQRIFAEQLPVVPLYLRLKLAATRPDMKTFVMDPTENSEMWNIEELDYGE